MNVYKAYLDGKRIENVEAENEDDAWDIVQDRYGVEDTLPNITVELIEKS